MARRVVAGAIGAAVAVVLVAGCTPPTAPLGVGPSAAVPPGAGAADAVPPDAGAVDATPPVRPAVLRIMPFGDSITVGAGSRAGDGYRARLHRDLTAAGLRVNFVGSRSSGPGPDPDHEGHSGWTMAQLSARADRWLRRARPDVVLLHVGTNDLRTDRSADRAPQRLARLLFQIGLRRQDRRESAAGGRQGTPAPGGPLQRDPARRRGGGRPPLPPGRPELRPG